MKLIIFLIIVLLIYFIATQIKVVHMDTLPVQQKNEIVNKSKIRSMLLTNHVKSKNNINPATELVDNFSRIEKFVGNLNYPEKRVNVIPFSNLLTMIKGEFLDASYRFNLQALPMTTRYPNKNTTISDKKYVKHVRNNLEEWNEFVQDTQQINHKVLTVRDIKLVFIMETERDFILDVLAKVYCNGKAYYLKIKYYGQIERSDDFLNGGSDVYIMQLVDLQSTSSEEYQGIVEDSKNKDYAPFMTMGEQLEYVDRINQLHREEMQQ